MKSNFIIPLTRILVCSFLLATTGCNVSTNVTIPTATQATNTLTSTGTRQPGKATSTLTASPPPSKTVEATVTLTMPETTPTQTRIDAVRLTATSPNQIRAILIDREGDLWTGGPGEVTYRGGPGIVVHWNLPTGKPTVYTPKDGLPNAFVLSITQTGDGAIWIGTWGGGIARFNGIEWQSFTTEDGLPSDYIAQVITRSDGSLWINTHNSNPWDAWAFGRFENEKWIKEVGGGWDLLVPSSDGSFWASHYETEVGHYVDGEWDGIGLSEVTALNVAPSGEVWAATMESVYKYDGKEWKTIPVPWRNQYDSFVTSIAFGTNGTIWFGFSYPRGLLDKCGSKEIYQVKQDRGIYQFDGKNWTQITTKDGLADNKICTIVAGPDGSMWVGTFDQGVSRYDGKTWTTYQVNDFMK